MADFNDIACFARRNKKSRGLNQEHED